MFDNTITFIIVLLVVLFVVIMKKIKSKKSTDCHKANKKKHKSLADVGAREEKIKNKEKELDNREKELDNRKEELNNSEKAIEKTREDFRQEWKKIRQEKDNIKKAHAEFENKQGVALRVFKKSTLEYQSTHEIFQSICNGRLNNAFDTDLYIKNLKISAEIGSGDHYYNDVTLTKCQCEDFKRKRKPCKHMLFLIYSLGVLQMYREECYRCDNWIQDIYFLQAQKKELEKKIKSAKNTEKNLDKKIRALQTSSEEIIHDIEARVQEKCEQEYFNEKKEMENKFDVLLQLYPDAEKIFNNDFDIENPPILIPYLPEATNHKKHRGTT